MRNPDEVKIGEYTLAEILEKHLHWLNTGQGSAADLSWAKLRNVDLSNVDLSGANLSGADLSEACLSNANLQRADLSNVDLYWANLRCANLRGANLNGASLYGALLWRSNLQNSSMFHTSLFNANLTNANLCSADMRYAALNDTCLDYANLHNANLYNANLSNVKLCNAKGNLIEYRKGKILTENIIGYKKCKDNIIVTLEIPRGAIVFSINGNKCRTNRAKVIAIDGADRAFSIYKYMSYYVGDEFNIYNFNCQYNKECGEGIHFFMTKEEAKNF